eukprot:3579050-Rhodomonas_salina.1
MSGEMALPGYPGTRVRGAFTVLIHISSGPRGVTENPGHNGEHFVKKEDFTYHSRKTNPISDIAYPGTRVLQGLAEELRLGNWGE